MPPIRTLASNPAYFEFRGRPTVLVSSAEHYGAVLNLDFDFGPYLDELARCGLNQTRTFSGAYAEIPGSFRIEDNTLAPGPGRQIAPWARSDRPGHPKGGNLFDLTRWDDEYFDRLRAFLGAAAERGVVVELAFFCQWYSDELWAASPLAATGNANGIGDVPRQEAYDAAHAALRRVQDEMVVKLVTELNSYENLYYELGNEVHYLLFPEFLDHVAALVRKTEAKLPNRHLIAAYFGNRGRFLAAKPADVDVVNFHYAMPDAAVANRHLRCPVVLNETGFAGHDLLPYRREAWRFLLCGGGGYSALDYSFTTSHPNGTAEVGGTTPGCGGPEWRAQVSFLKRFLEAFDLEAVESTDELLGIGSLGVEVDARVLAEPGKRYAVYLSGRSGGAGLGVGAPAGQYAWTWLDPATGEATETGETTWNGGYMLNVPVPAFDGDLLLELVRAK